MTMMMMIYNLRLDTLSNVNVINIIPPEVLYYCYYDFMVISSRMIMIRHNTMKVPVVSLVCT